jgi:hypothetical protein
MADNTTKLEPNHAPEQVLKRDPETTGLSQSAMPNTGIKTIEVNTTLDDVRALRYGSSQERKNSPEVERLFAMKRMSLELSDRQQSKITGLGFSRRMSPKKWLKRKILNVGLDNTHTILDKIITAIERALKMWVERTLLRKRKPQLFQQQQQQDAASSVNPELRAKLQKLKSKKTKEELEEELRLAKAGDNGERPPQISAEQEKALDEFLKNRED